MVGMALTFSEAVVAQEIHVYGPGGPAPAMSECARIFNSGSGANVVVTFGPTARWKESALHDADIFYSGAENMMTDFVRMFSGQIDEATIKPVYVRAAVILAHRGNPLKLERFADLLRPGVRIMIVQGSGQTGLWEDIVGRVGDVATIRALRSNIALFAPDTATAHEAWNSQNPPDAWIALAERAWGAS
jgi:accessory colonization factor AcfC